MIQNREYVKYIASFKPTENETPDLLTIAETLGVEIKTKEIEQDDEYFILTVVALYAWKLVILDRLFNDGAEKITIERLST